MTELKKLDAQGAKSISALKTAISSQNFNFVKDCLTGF